MNQRGTILLSVMVMVTALSLIAVEATDTVRFGIRRAANLRTVEQAHWYALGTEALARAALEIEFQRSPARTTAQAVWRRGPQRLPIQNGFLRGELQDNSNCFNVNALVQPGDEGLEKRPALREEFVRVLSLLRIPARDRQFLVDGLIDWLDSDTRPEASGAEDGFYIGQRPPYRTANGPIVDLSELAGIRGWTPALFAQLRPLLCAHPTHEPAVLNINLLSEERAVLLAAILEDEEALQVLIDVLAGRRDSGIDLESFWERFPDATDAMRARVDERSRYIRLTSRVDYDQTSLIYQAQFEQGLDGEIRLWSRRFGAR
ncbi:MAG: type II secretion system minor pseudopilin GspK [Rhodothalassiaceae bacterium]